MRTKLLSILTAAGMAVLSFAAFAAGAAAEYALVKDFPPEFDTDRAASLWRAEVTPGSAPVASLSVEVNGRTPSAPITDIAKISGKSSIVFGVVVNGAASEVNSFNAIVNGEAVQTTRTD